MPVTDTVHDFVTPAARLRWPYEPGIIVMLDQRVRENIDLMRYLTKRERELAFVR